jgi:cell division protein FtsB
MRYYRKQIDDLERQIRVLSNDRDTLETLAREQYLFAEPGDDVYLTK